MTSQDMKSYSGDRKRLSSAVPSANHAQAFPVLSETEEKELIRRWKVDGDQRALDRLIESHLRLVPELPGNSAAMGSPSAISSARVISD